MANFNYVSDAQEHVSRLKSKEQLLGKGLNIPFNATNSGSRKIMDNIHQSHALVLSRGEVPFIGTGYENKFGDRSTSIIKTDRSYQVIAKIPKFLEAPNHHYYLILADSYSNTLHIVERIAYKYIGESYGYLINNTEMDKYSEQGSVIDKDTVLRRSTGFDQYGNKTNGTNLNTVYLCSDNNMEDSLLISDICSEKMKAPFIKKVKRVVNENDIPLNLYGNDSIYKVFPDIGEDIKDGILAGFRREDKENAIYTQSVSRLQSSMMSDEKIRVTGKVIDINIYTNNPENLASNICNSQFNKYFQNRQRVCIDLVKIVSPFVAQGYELTYDLQKFFALCKDELSGKEFIDKRRFSNIVIEFFIMEEKKLDIGDKAADRFGGKGVVSKIIPWQEMPKLPNGQVADIIKNSSTMYGRENAGQVFEVSSNYISACILDYIRKGRIDAETAIDMICRFLNIIAPLEAQELRKYANSLKQDDFTYFVSTILEMDCIDVSALPITDTMTIDKLGMLYEEFPWIDQQYLSVPIKDSNGHYRFVNTRRKLIMGKQYNFRLKQIAEEKFSATSLSSTNIKNENTKSKDSKNYKEMHSNTPVRFGSMETGNMENMGSDIVIMNMMIYSLSPIGRRAVEEAYVGDPYNVDIKLNSKAKNRSVEQMTARLKTKGYRMVFTKKRKNRIPLISFDLIEFNDNSPTEKIELVQFKSSEEVAIRAAQAKKETEDIRNNSLIQISLISFD